MSDKAARFARGAFQQKEHLVRLYMDKSNLIAAKLDTEALSAEQRKHLRAWLDGALTDAFYTVLLALDGCTGLGDVPQQTYTLKDESGDLIAGDGELEVAAYEEFHEQAE